MTKQYKFIVFCIFEFYSLYLNAYHLCSHDESLSLLNLKANLQIDTGSQYCTNNVGFYSFKSTSSYCDVNGHPLTESKISSWNSSTDCCSWEGVTCDDFTGNVIELDLSFSRLRGVIHSNSTIFQLSHLKRLNLAYNFLFGSEISPQFLKFTHLSHLNLTKSRFQGNIPSEISQLHELVSLDLTDNYELKLEPHVFQVLLQNMTSLIELSLKYVYIDSTLPKNLSSSLTILNLMGTNLKGTFPYHIFHLPNLQQLSLGHDSFDDFVSLESVKFNTSSCLQKLELTQLPFLTKLPDTIGNLKGLTYLDLGSCGLTGTLPQSFGNLTHLSYLDLSFNNFNGQLPTQILALEHLTWLNVAKNSLDATIPHFAPNNLKLLKVLSLEKNKLTTSSVSSFLSNLTQLETIDLSYNPLFKIPPELSELSLLQHINLEHTQLRGPIPKSFSNLVNLQCLNLVSNNLSGHIGIEPFSSLVNLVYLNIGLNNLTGLIETNALSKFVTLQYLDFSSNHLGGSLDIKFLTSLKWMDKLDLSFNSLSLINEDNTTLPMVSIRTLSLGSCNIRKLDVLRSIVVQKDLYLANNSIHGEIPGWIWFNWINITQLDLSNNFITHIGTEIPLQSLEFLNLRSNLLQGELPLLPLSINLLYFSNNQFHGEIKPSFCQLHRLWILDLSNNSLTGALPHCIGMMRDGLGVLDLHMNKLEGTIPDTFSMCKLKTLNLRRNYFQGSLPSSLTNCSSLQFIDLSENKLNDKFPIWLVSLPSLVALSLRFNKFYGPMRASSDVFPNLRILDLSYNQLSGSLPERFFQGFEQMMIVDDTGLSYFWEGNFFFFVDYNVPMTMVLKGNDMKLDKVSMNMQTISLGCNHFEGEIPNSIGGLIAIQQLNLSHNNFSGQVPSELGNLSNLQTLDLSFNELDGKIPDEFAALGFLSVMDLSYNHLTGRIPTGTQLQTFPSDSYMGNDGLCGDPLPRCRNYNPSTVKPPHEFFDGFSWQSVLVGYGVGMYVSLVIGSISIVFYEKPKWLIRIVQEQAHRMIYT